MHCFKILAPLLLISGDAHATAIILRPSADNTFHGALSRYTSTRKCSSSTRLPLATATTYSPTPSPTMSVSPARAEHWWWDTPKPSEEELAASSCPNYSGCLCNPSVKIPRGRYCGGCSYRGSQVILMTGYYASSSDMFYCDGAFCCWMRNETCSPFGAWCEWQ